MADVGRAETDQEVEDEEYLCCSICFHKYDSHLMRPKILPCSHTFCFTCLQTIHSGTTLQCPLCNHQAVKIKNVSFLPNNKYVQHIVHLNEKLQNVQIQMKNFKDAIDNIIETPTTSRKLRVIDWGCLGFYVDFLAEIRIEYFVKVIRLQNPDIVFLSHIGEEVCFYLQKCFPSFFFICENMRQEENTLPAMNQHSRLRILRITMLNATVSYDSHDIISFPPAQPQDRDNFNMLKVKAHIGHMKFQLLNTNMNSNGSEVDFNQLKTIFEEVKNSDKSVNVILGVEGHLDDQEVKDVGGLPDRALDMQKVCDEIRKYRFNLDDSARHYIESISEEKFCNVFRTDRFFLRPASTGKAAVHKSFRVICIPTPYTTAFDHMVLMHDMMI